MIWNLQLWDSPGLTSRLCLLLDVLPRSSYSLRCLPQTHYPSGVPWVGSVPGYSHIPQCTFSIKLFPDFSRILLVTAGRGQQRPCGSPVFFKKLIIFNALLVWHSRDRGFDSLQLHHEACQGVTEKSVTPFSLVPCQLTANAPIGSDSPGPGRLTRFPPLPGDDLLKIFNRLPGKNSSSPQNFLSRFGLSDISDALAAENERRHGARRQEHVCASRGHVSMTTSCCFRGIFPQTLPSGWTLGLFECVGCAKSHATPCHRVGRAFRHREPLLLKGLSVDETGSTP